MTGRWNRGRASRMGAAIGVLLLAPSLTSARGLDVFNTASQVPATAAGPFSGVCSFGPLGQPLRLAEAVERALCDNPKTRDAWAAIKSQAAAVGAAKGAYLPTLSGQAQELRDNTKTNVNQYPVLDSVNTSSSYNATISLSWVLYDFGGRAAALDNATELLASAQAGHESALQAVFDTVAEDYYTAEADQGLLSAAEEIERTAKGSLDLATQLVRIGVSASSDALQAQTAYVQAQFDRTKAQGDWQRSLGTLAVDMALRPDVPITLPEGDGAIRPDRDFQKTISALIDDAVRHHPDVRAAQAQVRAAEAKIRQTQAEGMPSLSLVAQSSRNNQPVNISLGQPYLGATRTDNYIGLQVSVPLFEGFTRTYQVRQARADAERQQSALDDARQKVGLDVWLAYQSVQTATRNLEYSVKLLDIAEKSYEVAQHQYVIGTGFMIELLNAQTALAAARRQKIQSLADWRTSRLDLAAKLGRLDMGRIADGNAAGLP